MFFLFIDLIQYIQHKGQLEKNHGSKLEPRNHLVNISTGSRSWLRGILKYLPWSTPPWLVANEVLVWEFFSGFPTKMEYSRWRLLLSLKTHKSPRRKNHGTGRRSGFLFGANLLLNFAGGINFTRPFRFKKCSKNPPSTHNPWSPCIPRRRWPWSECEGVSRKSGWQDRYGTRKKRTSPIDTYRYWG